MLYAILCYNDEDTVWSWTKEEDAAVMGRLAVVRQRLAGKMGPSARLLPTTAATTLRKSPEPVVIDGPFAETKELVAGYWIWNVKSLDEAVEWAKRCPNPMPGEEGVLEIRPCYALEDLSELVPKAEFEREARLRKQVARQQKAKPTAAGKARSKTVPARKKSAKQKARRAKAK
jgi:hypothetical protein